MVRTARSVNKIYFLHERTCTEHVIMKWAMPLVHDHSYGTSDSTSGIPLTSNLGNQKQSKLLCSALLSFNCLYSPASTTVASLVPVQYVYSWTPLCWTRLSRTPRDLEQNTVGFPLDLPSFFSHLLWAILNLVISNTPLSRIVSRSP